jgi:hypothetical protein
MPPSSSSRDCDASELDRAPERGVKLNMTVTVNLFFCLKLDRFFQGNMSSRSMALAEDAGA